MTNQSQRALECERQVGWNEEERVAALRDLGVLDTPVEQLFDDIVQIAADACDAPIAVVNFIGADRQWFKAEVGIGARELPLDVSICRHAILQPGLFVVPDLTADPRFVGNPLVNRDGGLRFYAGALLETVEGLPIGTVCVLDTKPRPEGLAERPRRLLLSLARQVMSELNLRRALATQEAELKRTCEAEERATRQEQGLRESERRLRNALEAASMGEAEFNARTGQCIRSARVDELFGYAPGEAGPEASVLIDRIHPDDIGRVHQQMDISLQNGTPWHSEFRVVWPTGEVRWIASTGQAETDEDGQPARIVGVLRDVTKRKSSEERLQESEALLSAVLDALPVGAIIADADGKIVRDNQAHRWLWGMPPDTHNWEQYGEWVGFWPDSGERIKADEWAMSRALLHGEVFGMNWSRTSTSAARNGASS